MSIVSKICITKKSGDVMQEVETIKLVANKGIIENPINSMLRIKLNLDTSFSETFGKSPLLIGKAHRIYVTVG